MRTAMWAGQLGLRLCSVVWLCPLLCTARLFVRACRVSSEKKRTGKKISITLSELAILQSRGRLPRAAALFRAEAFRKTDAEGRAPLVPGPTLVAPALLMASPLLHFFVLLISSPGHMNNPHARVAASANILSPSLTQKTRKK